MALSARPGTRRRAACAALLTLLSPVGHAAPPPAGPIREDDLRRWVAYLASDELEGRAVFTEGLGLAAAYLAGELRAAGVEPLGDRGSYFQRVRVVGVKTTSRSTITVEAGGRSRTFKDGEGFTLPKDLGGKRRLEVDQVEFLGYGLDAPPAGHRDYEGRDVRGKLVVWLGPTGPEGLDLRQYRRLLAGRHRYATERMGALASIGVEVPRVARPGQEPDPAGDTPAPVPSPAASPNPAASPTPDFTTAQTLDRPAPPAVTAKEELLETLFAGQEATFADLKDKAARRAPLPRFALRGVKVTIDLDADYEVVRTQFTRNVVGVVRGSDPRLRDTYVAFGAHYDHIGYAEGEVAPGPNGPRRLGAPGRVKDGALEDRIWNGADDDASGTAALLAVARAAAAGARPRRSLLFVFHTGEERGLYGSRYFVDHATVPTGAIVAQLNIDMIGRNRNDKPEEANTVYLVGSDRISTELHNLNEEANARLPRPLTLDYEMNDPSDLEQIYYRSDHAPYAATGIPIIFFTTGLHPDYHGNADAADRLEYGKMARIAHLVYETGLRVANLDRPPARDNRGPRMGRGRTGRLTP